MENWQTISNNYNSAREMSAPPVLSAQKNPFDPNIPNILTHEQVYSIQVGDSLFRLSGASLSSDGPSYFTSFFLPYKDRPENERPTLYIDRSAKVFSYICRHLQGYWIDPENDVMYSYLVADALYYHLPKLMLALAESEIFVRIGTTQFRIPRDIFSNPGDSPNFFTIGFSTFFGAKPDMTFPKQLIRPLPLAPAAVTNRNAALFADLLDGLSGNFVDIKSDAHREGLLKEVRYYRFRGLEQRLIKHSIRKNLERNIEEIILELPDIKPSGIELVKQPHHGESYIGYKRPFVDDVSRELIIQVNDEEFRLMKSDATGSHLTCSGSSSIKMGLLIKSVRMLLSIHDIPAELTEMPYDINIENASITVDGKDYNEETVLATKSVTPSGSEGPASKKRKGNTIVIYLTKSQWRFSTVPGVPSLTLLKAVGYTKTSYKNASRDFL